MHSDMTHLFSDMGTASNAASSAVRMNAIIIRGIIIPA